jgi:citrate lyase synthetase
MVAVSVKIERKQFPLRLAYSMTYNKSQGQEFEQALVDIRNNPFTHGHLYVALTRVRKAKNVRLFTNPPKVSTEDGRTFLPLDPPDPPIVTNVVYDMLKL